jgi:hypothetical protein
MYATIGISITISDLMELKCTMLGLYSTIAATALLLDSPLRVCYEMRLETIKTKKMQPKVNHSSNAFFLYTISFISIYGSGIISYQ